MGHDGREEGDDFGFVQCAEPGECGWATADERCGAGGGLLRVGSGSAFGGVAHVGDWGADGRWVVVCTVRGLALSW